MRVILSSNPYRDKGLRAALEARRILERAGELGLIIVTHAGDDIGFPGVVRCACPSAPERGTGWSCPGSCPWANWRRN